MPDGVPLEESVVTLYSAGPTPKRIPATKCMWFSDSEKKMRSDTSKVYDDCTTTKISDGRTLHPWMKHPTRWSPSIPETSQKRKDLGSASTLSTTHKREAQLSTDMASAIQHWVPSSTLARFPCASTASPRASREHSRVSYYVKYAWSLRLTELVHNFSGSSRVDGTLRGGACDGRGSQARSGRSVFYGDAENYLLMEPGEDEQFVTAEELQEKLKKWLEEWPGEELPIDMTKYKNIDEAVQFLVNAVCELDLGDGQGSLQWYEVRLEGT